MGTGGCVHSLSGGGSPESSEGGGPESGLFCRTTLCILSDHPLHRGVCPLHVVALPEGAPTFENNYFAEMCSGSEAGSYLRLIDFVYHSTLGLRVMKKRREGSTESGFFTPVAICPKSRILENRPLPGCVHPTILSAKVLITCFWATKTTTRLRHTSNCRAFV